MSYFRKASTAVGQQRVTGAVSLPTAGLHGQWEARHVNGLNSVPTDGASVSTWTNLVAGGAGNFTAGVAPTFSASGGPRTSPAVVFNGTSHYLSISSLTLTERMWYVAWSAVSTSNGRVVYHWSNVSNTGSYFSSQSNGEIAIFQPTIYTSTYASISTETVYIDCVQMASSTHQAWRNGVSILGPNSGTVPTTTAQALLGASVGPGAYGNVKIMAVLLYTQAHDAATRDQVNAYLTQQYG